ncbi:MAG: S-layer homology domain-containing protein [Thermosyntropha sp.]|nr:S-layer homology domain-containing protein [Thermosyntropha sp.]
MPDITGGINNEYEYEEIVFISGEPIKFIGKFSVRTKEKDDEATVRYKLDLRPEDSSIKGKLSRQVTYEISYDRRTDKGQTIATIEVASFKESIDLGKDKYKLEDYQFSASDVIDNRPASDFYSGTITARKYYTINKDEGTVIVEINGGRVGYSNFWGSTLTQIVEQVISVNRQITTEDEETENVSWKGTVKIDISDSMRKSLKYEENKADFASFSGGHMRITNQEMYSRYEYDLPYVRDGKIDDGRRNRGEVELSKSMVPKIERLIVPKFYDTRGHWAQESIEKLYSLDVFTDDSSFFVPDAPMTRVEFARAVIKACDIRVDSEKKKRVSVRNKQPEVSLFEDMDVESDDYKYVKSAFEKGIMSGVAPDLFGPKDKLTRAQAVTILIRALGFEHKAPTPGFFTSFVDDEKIPDWAKDSVYVAREINLISGDTGGRFNPDKVMTRAEAAAMLVKFLEFMEKDLQKNYREEIILYR